MRQLQQTTTHKPKLIERLSALTLVIALLATLFAIAAPTADAQDRKAVAIERGSATLVQAKADLAAKQLELGAATDQLDAANATLSKTRASLTTAQADVSSLNAGLKNTEAALATATAEAQEAEGRVASANKTVATAQTAVDRAVTVRNAAEKNVTDARTRLIAATDAAAAVTADRVQLGQIQADLTAASSNGKALSASLAAANKATATAQAEVTAQEASAPSEKAIAVAKLAADRAAASLATAQTEYDNAVTKGVKDLEPFTSALKTATLEANTSAAEHERLLSAGMRLSAAREALAAVMAVEQDAAAALDTNEAAVRTLTAQAKTLEERITLNAGAAKQVAAAQAELEAAEANFSKENAVVAKTQADLDANVQVREAAQSELTKQLDVREAAAAEQVRQLSAVDQLTKQIATDTATVEQTDADIKSLDAQLHALQAEVNTLETAVRDLEGAETPTETAKTVNGTRGVELPALTSINEGNPITAELTEGTMPAGVKLGKSGTLGGAPSKAGETTVKFMITDTITGDREIRTVNYDIEEPAPAETSATVKGIRGEALTALTAINDDNPITAELTEGTMPAGVKLAKDGTITGAPTKAGETTVKFMITDTLTGDGEIRTVTYVTAEREAVKTVSEIAGKVAAELAPLAPINDGNPITAELTEGTMPEGTKLNEDGTITGTPTKAGTTKAVVAVFDTVTFEREERTILFTVDDSDIETTSETRAVTLADPVSAVAPINEGNGIDVSIVDGDMPAGLELVSNGDILGSTTSVGDSTVTFLITDTATGEREKRTVLFSVGMRDATETSLDLAVQVGESVDPLERLDADNTISVELVSGSLPEGLTLTDDGSFDGAPVESGTFTAVAMITDDVSFEREIVTLQITSEAATPAERTSTEEIDEGQAPSDLAPIDAGNDISAEVVDGSLPDGVRLNSDGTFTGTVTTPGVYEYVVLVTDEVNGSAELRATTLTVRANPAIRSDQVQASVGSTPGVIGPINAGNDITATLAGGTLPSGLTLTSTGAFSGATAATGTFVAEIMVEDMVTGERELRTVTFVVAQSSTSSTTSSTAPVFTGTTNFGSASRSSNTSTSTSNAASTTPRAAASATDAPSGPLAYTGSETSDFLLLGTLLIAVGGAALLVARRCDEEEDA